MKFVCDRCKTRYSIGDDRVRGKILKIRCKNCANVITVREGMSADEPAEAARTGTRNQRPTTMAPPAAHTTQANPIVVASQTDPALAAVSAKPANGAKAAPPPAALDEEWYVSIDGNQSGPYSLAEAQRWVGSRPFDAELHCWTEGFDDWLPVDKVSHFRGLRKKPAPPPPAPAPPPVPRAPTRTGAQPILRAQEDEPKPLFAATMASLEKQQQTDMKGVPPKATPSGGVPAVAQSGQSGATAKSNGHALPSVKNNGTGPRKMLDLPTPRPMQAPVRPAPLDIPPAANGEAWKSPTGPKPTLAGTPAPQLPLPARPATAPGPAGFAARPATVPGFDVADVPDGDGSTNVEATPFTAPAPMQMGAPMTAPAPFQPPLPAPPPTPVPAPAPISLRELSQPSAWAPQPAPAPAPAVPTPIGRDDSGPASSFEDDMDIGEVSRVVKLADIARTPPKRDRTANIPRMPTARPSAQRMTASVQRLAPEEVGAITNGTAPVSSIVDPLLPPVAAQDPAAVEAPPLAPLPAPNHKKSMLALMLVALLFLGGAAAVVIYIVASHNEDPLALNNEPGHEVNIDRPDEPHNPLFPNIPQPPPEGSDKPVRPNNPPPIRPNNPPPIRPNNPPPNGSNTSQVTDGPNSPLKPEEVEDMYGKSSFLTNRCWQLAQKKNPYLPKDVKRLGVIINIDGSGGIKNVSIEGLPSEDGGLGNCLQNMIRGWHFRQSKDGLTAKITMAFQG